MLERGSLQEEGNRELEPAWTAEEAQERTWHPPLDVPSHCSRVVLRVLEVPLLPVALEALGSTGEALWAARRAPPRTALLCTARPLSYTWTLDGRGIVAVRARPTTKCTGLAIAPPSTILPSSWLAC